MDADWSVELRADDAALEFPWISPDRTQHYIDLQRQPERLREIPEATRFPELGECLLAINTAITLWLTAKCDAWMEIICGTEAPSLGAAGYDAPEAAPFQSASFALKLCSYVDLVFREEDPRFCFARHEQWVKSAVREFSGDDDLPVLCEFIVRRCWYHPEVSTLREFDDTSSLDGEDPLPGFYVTCYLFGYGNDEAQTRARWAEGLRRVSTVLTALAP